MHDRKEIYHSVRSLRNFWSDVNKDKALGISYLEVHIKNSSEFVNLINDHLDGNFKNTKVGQKWTEADLNKLIVLKL